MIIEYKRSDSGQLSRNFRLAEFRCKCGKCASLLVDTALVDILQQIRDHFGVSVDINSGYRCKEHNVDVGGDPNSSHMQGMAADIRVRGVEPREVAKFAESIGVKRIGLYEGDEGEFVHIGSGVTKRFWLGHKAVLVNTFGAAPQQLCTVSVPVLKRGMKNDTVAVVQLLLIGLGYDIEADGSFGPATEAAVRQYQQRAGLGVDGSVGPVTWARLLGV